MKKKYKVAILIGTANRAGEVGLLLQSIRTQTWQNFDVYLLDDASQVPLGSFYFITNLINRMKLEGHNIFVKRNDTSKGISRMRNQMAKCAVEEGGCNLFCRVDDDTILEKDFLER